jgi:hypothetical protein
VEKPSHAAGSPYFPFTGRGRRPAKRLDGRVVLAGVAFVACGNEVGFVVRTAAGEGDDVVNHGSQVVEQWSAIAAPSRIVVGE